MSKKGTSFVKAKNINNVANACFNRLKENNYFVNMEINEFINNITDFYCVTNNLHPFREGNGRTQRIFLSQLANKAGYEINFSKIDTDILMIATIQASNGITANLRNALSEIITPIAR